MQDNPYQSSLVVPETNVELGRPIGIYFWTAVATITMASLVGLIGWIGIRYYRPFLTDVTLLVVIMLAVAALSSTIAGCRTWTRLTRVHVLRLRVQQRRESVLREISAAKR